MNNLMTATSTVKQHILSELREGNTEVLKGLPPILAMECGIAMQNEEDNVKDPSPIDDKAVSEAMLSRMADTGIKERILAQMEADKEGTS